MNFSLSLHLLGVEVAKCSHTVWNSCGNYEMRLILAIKMNIKHECLQCRRYIDPTELLQHLSQCKLTGEKSSRAVVHRVNLFQSLPRVLGVLYIHGWRKKRQESSQFWDIKWMRLSTMMCFHLTLTPKSQWKEMRWGRRLFLHFLIFGHILSVHAHTRQHNHERQQQLGGNG